MNTPRIAQVHRRTSESDIRVEINLDGSGTANIQTGLPFFDHMLTAFCTHGAFDLEVIAQGDTHIDAHHTVEDTAIVLGQAIAQALGDKAGIRRFGQRYLPMDEALVRAVIDLSGRSYSVITGEPENMQVQVIGGHYPTVINHHFFETLAQHSQATLHLTVLAGRDPHHITEAEFKAVARSLREACENDERIQSVPSTKGTL
ncbi:imidazoleglycerol-phosphate dehydratase HisB [Corynebacterium tapiri]|uniref:Imidazoleglycerol-phosphate dehydratase n=1 Tax=Corynebacterium tapiri TaxID=1448266 RepID=A0A5C4U6H2_9CORY|nr:imidazoleglycerol-phosphate dehydratase HisB [Corynebacterium tapiri]TNL99357.1 imidazoleglycerol-phosphate dehydratase HisB [Corynebacterium tapiri]